MAAPMNLTLKRGPSVWEDHNVWSSNWRTYGVVAGACIAGAALQREANRSWLMGVGLGLVGASLLAGRVSSALEAGKRQLDAVRGGRKDDVVDRASEDSFPASDAPQHR